MVTIENRDALERTDAHAVALECIVAGIEAAHPERIVAESISTREGVLAVAGAEGDVTEYELDRYEDVYVVGGGNAAGHLARAIEDALGDALAGGVVVTDDPAGTSVVEEHLGDHPIPSEDGVAGARRVLEVADRAGEDDLVVACITGGGSALLPAPAGSISLADLQSVTESLLECGASIDEINAVRKHCSSIKGGQLARRAAPATVATLAISDVVGDRLDVIASGPTAPDPTAYADALEVLERYELSVPETVSAYLEAGDRGEHPETVAPGDPLLESVRVHVLGSGRTALEAAREVAADRGYEPLVLSSRVRGEASESAITHAAIAEECAETGDPISPPAAVLSGGETTVTLAGDHGSGGPNQEFVLSGAVELESDAVVVASVDTDGIDGATDAAGAIATAADVSRTEGRRALATNDALPILESAETIVRTGPTGTNVNDLRILVVED
ncbi:glycerate kinase type-2 family protein [Natronococcus jeotgali]|uniref:Hydroxypyruvate reductase n=1 Tax=Natronococcus jeotgali DSM 18795 TaxID=1227498 RepID=L9XGN9_9EURY|nr:DUF4147 domain-containing protein [Natronococcus jeotgali]ELY60885.1 hydroxypyruvate reductase [Natronococcus jeotgali DSM 18795]